MVSFTSLAFWNLEHGNIRTDSYLGSMDGQQILDWFAFPRRKLFYRIIALELMPNYANSELRSRKSLLDI